MIPNVTWPTAAAAVRFASRRVDLGKAERRARERAMKGNESRTAKVVVACLSALVLMLPMDTHKESMIKLCSHWVLEHVSPPVVLLVGSLGISSVE